MAIEGVPWMVSGGKHSAEVGRALAFAATFGATGVTLPGDLKVTALPTPGGAVRVAAGSASIVSRFPGATGQSYTARGVGSTDIDVAKAGTTTTTRYVIIRITDPAYAGQPVPANPAVGPYAILEVVSSITNLAVPFIALAEITIPANTAVITQAMIRDLRVMANPRSRNRVRVGSVTGEVAMKSTTGGRWPSFQPMIDVPEWATYMTLVTIISSVGHLGGDTEGTLTTTLGEAGATQWRASNTFWDLEQDANQGMRHQFVIGDEGPINPALRGTSQRLATEARLSAGPGYLITKGGTHVAYNVTFSEELA